MVARGQYKKSRHAEVVKINFTIKRKENTAGNAPGMGPELQVWLEPCSAITGKAKVQQEEVKSHLGD